MKQLERSGIPWPVFAVTVAAAFMVAVLGVALLIAIVGTPVSLDQALYRFRIEWLVGAGVALGSAAISSFHRRPAEAAVAVPVVLAPAEVA
jgi:hypothetical protein